jgi:hypothetical protein
MFEPRSCLGGLPLPFGEGWGEGLRSLDVPTPSSPIACLALVNKSRRYQVVTRFYANGYIRVQEFSYTQNGPQIL